MDYESETLVAHSLRGGGFDASEDGTGRGTPLIASYAIQAGALRENPDSGPDGVGVQEGHAYTLEARAEVQAICFSSKDHGADAQVSVSPTLRAMNFNESHANAGGQLAVAWDMRGREGGAQFEGPHETANIRAASGGSSRSYVANWMVRRLTPRECERLQGFPEDYTAIPYRGKTAADGPRYKALGNSMAVNCMRWIGRRIEMVERVIISTKQ